MLRLSKKADYALMAVKHLVQRADGGAASAREIAEQYGIPVELLAKVLPDYPATGKRTLQDNGSWLACLKRENVDLVRTPIDRVVADGLVTTDGTHYAADVICYATGFRHNDYLWPMTIRGRGGQTLRDVWATAPYLHDGSAPTLEAAVRAHRDTVIGDAELSSLAAYLREIGREESSAPTRADAGNGTGLSASYFNNTTLTGSAALAAPVCVATR